MVRIISRFRHAGDQSGSPLHSRIYKHQLKPTVSVVKAAKKFVRDSDQSVSPSGDRGPYVHIATQRE